MLEFFRRYQRFFFLIITVVIVISFSFFGTYHTLVDADSGRDQIAFTAIDGSGVTRGELNQMVLFLGTDSHDKLVYSGMWGPNFLNNGVILQNFLETGMGLILAEHYQNELKDDLQLRLEKEKRYVSYSHPQAKFINAVTAWSYFAPEIKANDEELRQSENSIDPQALSARINLYIAEKQFPAPMLRQVLRYQEKQYSWLPADESLDRLDLSLYGHHTLEDWFGPHFIELISQFIINSAKIAEQKGYQVTREEALIDLLRNAENSFQQNKGSPHLGVASAAEYFNEQLRRMGMDQTQAVKLWRQVLLFKEFFEDVGRSAFVSPFEGLKLDSYAKEGVEGDLYQLPKPLRLTTYRAMQKLEVYLDAVAKRGDLLMLPTLFLSAAEVEKRYPQLVQRRYLLEVSEYDKKNLLGRVSLKETWNWEVEDENWVKLMTQFPELGIKSGATREERFTILDGLDNRTRGRVDSFARSAIVDLHPEWLVGALEQAKTRESLVGIRLKGGPMPFVGLEKNDELIRLLDADDQESKEKLNFFTANGQVYYRIAVLDRDPNKEVVTFAEANSDDVLDRLLTEKLEASYQVIREKQPTEFQTADGKWKELTEVRDRVADITFEKVLKAIREDYKEQGKESIEAYAGDFYAKYRLYKYVREAKREIQADPANGSLWFEPVSSSSPATEKLTMRAPLANQWKLDKESYRLSRSEGASARGLDITELFSLPVEGWSSVSVSFDGTIAFFKLKEKKDGSSLPAVALKMEKVQQILSYEAQRLLTEKMLK